MKHAIELFAALRSRLASFGSEDSSRRVIAEACQVNGWFSQAEVRRAVAAVSEQMLREDLLREWLAHYPTPVTTPRRVLVVMAGNIPLVGFFDLLCVVASGHRCLVKPSAKDTPLMIYIIKLLHEIDPDFRIEIYDGKSPVEAVIATGSDNANRYFRAHFSGVPSLLRGSRQSVAVLSGRETPEQLAGLSDDIWAYSSLGCRNVSLVFMPEDYDLQLTMPPVCEKYRNNYRQRRALLMMEGQPFLDLGAAVAVEQQTFPTFLSQIAYARYASLDQVSAWLAEHDEQLQCVVTECLSHSRRAGFGCAQSPALTDYPDDRDVMAFLTTLER